MTLKRENKLVFGLIIIRFNYLKEFLNICVLFFIPMGLVSEEHVRLRLFPFSLKDKAKG